MDKKQRMEFVQLALVAIVAIVGIVVLVLSGLGVPLDFFSSSLFDTDSISGAAILPASVPSTVRALVGSLYLDGAVMLEFSDFKVKESYLVSLTTKNSFRVWKVSLSSAQQAQLASQGQLVEKLSGDHLASGAMVFVWIEGTSLRVVELTPAVMRSLR